MSSVHVAFTDPRRFAASQQGVHADWYALARTSLAADTAHVRDHADAALGDALGRALAHDAADVETAVDRAPSAFIARHLWRIADSVWRACAGDDALAITPFALPVVIITGARDGTPGTGRLSAVLPDVHAVAQCLRQGDALRGNQMLALADVLVSASALAISALPRWARLREIAGDVHDVAREFTPADIMLTPGESVHVRYMVGSAMAARGVDLLRESAVGRWGATVTRELVRQLASTQASVLALPRAPQTPLVARHEGLVAQREVSAQLFASNAIRAARASTGEPVAVISSHRAPDAPGGGELRLSISSLLEPRDAQGFRCPIYPIEPVSAPLSMLLDLLHDCRVTDTRLVAGVHPDNAAGMPLFFKPDTIPEGALLQ